MFKHTVEYVDFNGAERKDDLYFHLSLPEVVRLEAEIGKPLETHIKDLTTNQNLNELLTFLEKLMLGSYGEKTLDGKSFFKSEELKRQFEHSQAYAELFEQVITNPELAKKFGEKVVDNGKNRKNQVTPQVVSTPSPQA